MLELEAANPEYPIVARRRFLFFAYRTCRTEALPAVSRRTYRYHLVFYPPNTPRYVFRSQVYAILSEIWPFKQTISRNSGTYRATMFLGVYAGFLSFFGFGTDAGTGTAVLSYRTYRVPVPYRATMPCMFLLRARLFAISCSLSAQ